MNVNIFYIYISIFVHEINLQVIMAIGLPQPNNTWLTADIMAIGVPQANHRWLTAVIKCKKYTWKS
jgi:hypothetical protein